MNIIKYHIPLAIKTPAVQQPLLDKKGYDGTTERDTDTLSAF